MRVTAATAIAVETIGAGAQVGSGVQKVVFACFSDEVLEAYRKAGVGA